MSRLDELKQKGWLHLSAPEREEYKALLETEAGGQKKTVSAAQMSDVIEERTNYIQNPTRLGDGKWQEYHPPKPKNKTARFKLWRADSGEEYGLIIDWHFHKNMFNEETRKHDDPLYIVKLLYSDGTTKDVEMLWRDFAKILDFEICEVVKTDMRKLRKVHDRVRVPVRNKDGYVLSRSVDGAVTGILSAVEVETDEIRDDGDATCLRNSGQQFTVNISRLNA